MFQQLDVTGRIANDVVLRYTPNGKAVLQLAVIVNNSENNKTTFNFACFDKYAETHANYLSKGDLIRVFGTMQNKVEERDGYKNYTYSLYANRVIYLITAKSKQAKTPSDSNVEQVVNNTTKPEEDPFAVFGEEVVINSDDLPF